MKCVLTIFTVGHGNQREILPFIVKNVLDGLHENAAPPPAK